MERIGIMDLIEADAHDKAKPTLGKNDSGGGPQSLSCRVASTRSCVAIWCR